MLEPNKLNTPNISLKMKIKEFCDVHVVNFLQTENKGEYEN